MLRMVITAALGLTSCAAAPDEGGLRPVAEMECVVSGITLESLSGNEICARFTSAFTATAPQHRELSAAIEIRTPFLAKVSLSDAQGKQLLERDLSITDASLNGRVFEKMAISMAAEISAGE